MNTLCFTQEFQKSSKRFLLRTGAEAKVVFIIRSDKLIIREFIRIMTNIPIHIRGNLIGIIQITYGVAMTERDFP